MAFLIILRREADQAQCHVHKLFSTVSLLLLFCIYVIPISIVLRGVLSSEKLFSMTHFSFTISDNFPPHSCVTFYIFVS